MTMFNLIAVTATRSEYEIAVSAKTLAEAKEIAASVWGGCRIKLAKKPKVSPLAARLGRLVGM